ncbi:MAG: hypothetical protein WBN75_16430 [Verrucomicrobiia bacterium]
MSGFYKDAAPPALGQAGYNKQGYVVVDDVSPQGRVTTLEEIQKLLDDPNSVLNKEL